MTTRTDLRLPSFEDVQLAAKRIAGMAHRTPVLTSRTADAATRRQALFQGGEPAARRRLQVPRRLQCDRRTGAEARRRGVIAFSSGNHAQAIAYAASLRGRRRPS